MISLDKYRAYLKTTASEESEIVDVKDEVEDLWREETQRPWKTETDRVEVHRTSDKRIDSIFLPLTPVTVVTKVEIKGEGAGENYEELLLADGGWEVINDTLVRLGTWWKPLTRVTYTGGYATDTVPASIRRALLLQAKFVRERLDTNVNVSSQNSKGGAGNYVAPTMHEHFALLAEDNRKLV